MLSLLLPALHTTATQDQAREFRNNECSRTPRQMRDLLVIYSVRLLCRILIPGYC